MTEGSFVPLAGSERNALRRVQDLGPVSDSERIEVTVMLRRRAELPGDLVEGPQTISLEDLAGSYGAAPADVELASQVLTGFGLEITETHPASRRLKVAGTAPQPTQAVGVTLRRASSPGPGGGQVEHRYREGGLHVPAALDGIVTAVVGLDNRPQVRAQFRTAATAAQTTCFHHTTVAQAY